MQSWFVTKKNNIYIYIINQAKVFFLNVSPNVEDGTPIHCINYKPTNRNPHKSIKGLQVQRIAQVAFDCICLEILFHIASPCSLLVSLPLITISTPGYKRKLQEQS